MRWEIVNKEKGKDIINILLKNRDIKTEKQKEEFFNPIDPMKIKIGELGIGKLEIRKAIDRIKQAKENKEHVIIYGDYDADGVCATAIMWEALHSFGLNVLPYIPDRFSDGYGIKSGTVKKIFEKDPLVKLIITVDNGIVAYDGIDEAKKIGIDVIVVDHHQKGGKKLSTPYILHSTSVCGSALTWFFTKELGFRNNLELAAIGTVSDQMPLAGINRSIVKFGLTDLEKTKRPGFRELFKNSKIEKIGTYEINYIIAPRINAMGRLAHGLDSLRLLCTKSPEKAKELAKLLDKTNYQRQEIVDSVVAKALKDSERNIDKLLVISHESFHEGVIGLAAGKLVEEFYRPAIVFSKKEKISKASGRSIPGFNIIEAIRATGLISEGGGHPMAAGFSIETEKIEIFAEKINKIADKLLTRELLTKKLKIDLMINFSDISQDLYKMLLRFEPFGVGNFAPIFATEKAEVTDAKTVGRNGNHLKLKLKQNEQIFDAIFFGGGKIYSELTSGAKIDVAYQIEENVWNGGKNLQLKIKDIKL